MSDPTNEITLSNLYTFKDLVEFPLNAIIDSSANANKTTIDFIKSFCFKVVNGRRVAKTFEFYYDYIKDGAAQTLKVEIPIISLITLPYYTIDRAEFEMGVNVISWIDNPLNDPASDSKKSFLSMLGPYESINKSTHVSESSLHYNQVTTNMNVKMEVVTSDLPAGVLQMLNTSAQGIEGIVYYDFSLDPIPKILDLDKNKSLPLHVKKYVDGAYVDVDENIELNITVKSNTSTNTDNDFSEPMSTNDFIIGKSSISNISVLTDTSGKAKITFHPKNVTSNGIITISSSLLATVRIYYQIKMLLL